MKAEIRIPKLMEFQLGEVLRRNRIANLVVYCTIDSREQSPEQRYTNHCRQATQLDARINQVHSAYCGTPSRARSACSVSSVATNALPGYFRYASISLKIAASR